MSDVERICEVNHERRRWAEEYEGERIAAASSKPRNDREVRIATAHPGPRNDRRGDKMRRVMRAGSLACAMAAGSGAAFLGMGIAMQHTATIVVGAVVAAVFLLVGSAMEWEGER